MLIFLSAFEDMKELCSRICPTELASYQQHGEVHGMHNPFDKEILDGEEGYDEQEEEEEE
jgi:hypothetical protein